MQKPSDDGPVKPNIQARSMDERTDAAVMLLKGLNPLQVQADKDGFSFLSYLLRMAIMEAQEIASGSTGEFDKPPGDNHGPSEKSSG